MGLNRNLISNFFPLLPGHINPKNGGKQRKKHKKKYKTYSIQKNILSKGWGYSEIDLWGGALHPETIFDYTRPSFGSYRRSLEAEARTAALVQTSDLGQIVERGGE